MLLDEQPAWTERSEHVHQHAEPEVHIHPHEEHISQHKIEALEHRAPTMMWVPTIQKRKAPTQMSKETTSELQVKEIPVNKATEVKSKPAVVSKPKEVSKQIVKPKVVSKEIKPTIASTKLSKSEEVKPKEATQPKKVATPKPVTWPKVRDSKKFVRLAEENRRKEEELRAAISVNYPKEETRYEEAVEEKEIDANVDE
jgi:hypothetical protein